MFKGLGGLGDMGKMMKAAQETQEKMARMQEDLALIEVKGESGAGLVKATATAKGELTGLEIDPSIFIDGLEHNKIIFINGRIEKIDFNFEDQNKIEIIDETKKDISFDYENSLIDLNSAFTDKVFKILVKKDYSLKKPLIIYHSTNDSIKSTNINLRLDFELGENSCLKLIDYFTNNTAKNFINIFYNFNLEKDSILKNYKIDKFINNNLKYSFNNIEQDNNSVSETFIFTQVKQSLQLWVQNNMGSEQKVNGNFEFFLLF